MKKSKKILPILLPIIVAPILQCVSCSSNKSTSTFIFSFNGAGCTINGQHEFTDEVQKGQAVSYKIMPDPGCLLLEESLTPLPDGVVWDYETSSLIIVNMNKPYSVDFIARHMSDYFTFDCDDENKTATITSYSGEDASLQLPEIAIINDKEYIITAIGQNAFSNKSLVSIAIPNTIKTIGDNAFGNCIDLESVTIANSVTNIGKQAFQHCEQLKSISIPDSVTTIGEQAFQYCKQLESISIPNSVTTIGKQAFQHCEQLKSISIPDSVTTIGEESFLECSKLESVKISNSVKSIEKKTFCGCKVLSDITLPTSLESIGNEAFYICTGLTTITIPTSVVTIGVNAFKDCSSMTDTSGPSGKPGFQYAGKISQWRNIIDRGENWHGGTTPATKISCTDDTTLLDNSIIILDYEYHDADQTATVTGIKAGMDTHIDIPDKVIHDGNEYTVTAIGYKAFEEEDTLESISIPDSVTTIGEESFLECSKLESVDISNSVKSIEKKTFYGCEVLSDITLPTSLESIGNEAFYKCTGLTTITIPTSVVTIGDNAFKDCSSMTDTSGPSGDPGFQYAGEISEWRNLIDRGENWHGGTTPATKICCTDDTTLLDNSIIILDYEYHDADQTATVTGIKAGMGNHIDIPDKVIHNGNEYTVTAIGYKAFEEEDTLESISISDSVTTIGEQAFSDCRALSSIEFGNSITKIGRLSFSCCDGLTSVDIPNSIKEIGENAFDTCLSLTSVTIGNGINTIKNNAFDSCAKLKYVVIGKSIKEIGKQAFQHCYALTDTSAPDMGPGLRFAGPASDWIMTNRAVEWHKDSTITKIKCNDIEISLDTLPDQELTYTYDDTKETATVTGFSSKHSVVYVPKTVELDGGKTYTVTAIGDNAFQEGESGPHYLQSMVLPTTIKTIGSNAFQYCSSLHSINIPDSVTSMGQQVFRKTGLESVVLSKSLRSINLRAFNGCDKLTSITIPNAVTSIGKWAFASCGKLTNTSGPNNTPGIHFDGNYSDFIEINRDSTWLENTSENLIQCNDVAIKKDAVVDNNLQYEFDSQNLTAIIKGTSGSETEVYIPQTVEYDEKTYNVVAIKDAAFGDHSGIKNVIIPHSVTDLGAKCFTGCSSLASIYIPDSVTHIGDFAFQFCNNPKLCLYLPHSVPPAIGRLVFDSVDVGIRFHIKVGTRELYRQADGWKDFGDILFVEDQ